MGVWNKVLVDSKWATSWLVEVEVAHLKTVILRIIIGSGQAGTEERDRLLD